LRQPGECSIESHAEEVNQQNVADVQPVELVEEVILQFARLWLERLIPETLKQNSAFIVQKHK
jgi:hypothetical protein